MFRKSITIAFRSLRKDLPYAITNLAGLTIGITCCLLIFSFVRYETSFDRFHSKADRIYRVNYDVLMGGNETVSPSVPVFVAPVIKSKFPEIEDVTRFLSESNPRTIKHGDVLFDEKGFSYGDPNFFKILDYKLVAGDLQTALSSPNTLVITRDIARKYFGKTNPIGQTLLFNNQKPFLVKAVIENMPSNASFGFSFLTSFYSIAGFDSLETQQVWNNPNYTTLLLLKRGANVAGLSSKIDTWVNPPGEPANTDNTLHLQLQPFTEIHFDTKVFNFKNMLVITDPAYINIFITVAVLVLLIACANYVNLATAKATARAKEVGIRKAIGANFWQLFTQFLTESFLLVVIAVVLSVAAVHLLLPYLNILLGKEIPAYTFDSNFLLIITAGIAFISLLAGFYPALVLSRLKAVETLKGATANTHQSGISVRSSLVVFQFTISVALIVGTVIVQKQLQYMQSEKLGFDKDHVLIVHGNSDIYGKLNALGAEIKKVNGVKEVSLTWRSPFETVVGNGFSIKANPSSNDDWHVVGGIAADEHYLSALGIPLLAGRNFDPAKIKGDSTINEFIVNEAFLKHYQLGPKDAVGKQVILGIAGSGTVVGVMKDFHISSMHDKIEPVVLFNSPKWFGNVVVKAGSGNIPQMLANIQKAWQSFAPERPFTYSFLDEEYDAMYRTEQRLGALMSCFCGVAVVITCLGLLGLMTFIVAQRTKEIGIRKVLGASVLSITALLSKEFLRLVAIAVLIAMPLAWYVMNKWLEDYNYRIAISWQIFAFAAVAAILIAVATVSLQAIKAAIANPVKSLRTE